MHLSNLHVPAIILMPTIFINLVRCSPKLNKIYINSISNVDNPETAAGTFDLFMDIFQRSLKIWFDSESHRDIWKSEKVKSAVKYLKEESGTIFDFNDAVTISI